MSKLILSDNQVGLIAEKVDDDVKTGLAEPIDGWVFKAVIGFLNKEFSDDVPEEFHDEIRDGLMAYQQGNLEGVSEQVLRLIEEAVSLVSKRYVRNLFGLPVDNLVLVKSEPGKGPNEEPPGEAPGT